MKRSFKKLILGIGMIVAFFALIIRRNRVSQSHILRPVSFLGYCCCTNIYLVINLFFHDCCEKLRIEIEKIATCMMVHASMVR